MGAEMVKFSAAMVARQAAHAAFAHELADPLEDPSAQQFNAFEAVEAAASRAVGTIEAVLFTLLAVCAELVSTSAAVRRTKLGSPSPKGHAYAVALGVGTAASSMTTNATPSRTILRVRSASISRARTEQANEDREKLCESDSSALIKIKFPLCHSEHLPAHLSVSGKALGCTKTRALTLIRVGEMAWPRVEQAHLQPLAEPNVAAQQENFRQRPQHQRGRPRSAHRHFQTLYAGVLRPASLEVRDSLVRYYETARSQTRARCGQRCADHSKPMT